MKFSFPIGVWKAVFVLLAATVALGADDPAPEKPPATPVEQARRLFQEGKYGEAVDAYQALPAEQAAVAAVGLARCQEATGEREKADATLAAASQKLTDVAALPAERARLALARGDFKTAASLADAALKLDKKQVLAQWVQAEVACDTGDLAAANTAYQRLVNVYNNGDVKDPEALHRIGLAAAQFARWNRVSDQFSFLVNEFYPDLLTLDPTCWQAHFETGRLFAEKYNQPQAAKALKAALELNPNSADIHAALGQLSLEEFEIAAAQASCDRALEINPQLLAAVWLKADIHLANFEPRQCVGILQEALKLNPVSEATLGRIAAAYAAIDGVAKEGPQTRFGKVVSEVTARNPQAGVFYETLADALDRLRRWPAAARYYQEARKQMPQLVRPAGQWGMMLMRLGEEEQARVVLDEAFKIDPFNVRVNNSLKVLEVLDDYQTLETEHFRIRYDGDKDKLMAQYMGQWLEEVYPELVKRMGFAPPDKSLFEVFNRARNTDGHGWFSARMVGLPHIHPIGACAGKIVALSSPSEGKQRFNWARVIKHEFVHVVNLQQTDFNIPHWFTEALAVLSEGYPRPQSWNELLVERSAQGKLFTLDSINLGFIRPHSSEEWTLAYCQASLYAQYMLDRFGEAAVARMLAGYADNLTTPEALQRAFNVAQPEFERGYSEYLKKLVAELPTSHAQREVSVSEAQKAVAANPKDPAALASLAQAQLARSNYPQARRSVDAALALEPRNALASYVRARLHLLVGENKEALARLEGALDRQTPQEKLLALLAGLKFKAEDYQAAAELYELGASHDPANPKWLKSLAAVYLKMPDEKRLMGVLTKLAAADADDLPVRKKLAQLAAAQGDRAASGRWALEALHIDVMEGQLHQWRAEALEAAGSHAAAAEEYAATVELDPDDPKPRLSLAQAYAKAGQPDKAKAALSELRKRDPDHPGAAKLEESLK